MIKKILKAVNEGVYNALTFNKDELEPSEEFDMLIGSGKKDIDTSKKDLEKTYYSRKLQEMLPDALQVKTMDIYKLADFVYDAIEWHKEYGVTYNPHLDGEDFKGFVANCLEAYTDDWALDLNWIDTSEVTDMTRLFYDTKFAGNISEWDVSNVTNIRYIFYNNKHFNCCLTNWKFNNFPVNTETFYNTEIRYSQLSEQLKMCLSFEILAHFKDEADASGCINFNDDLYETVYAMLNKDLTDDGYELLRQYSLDFNRLCYDIMDNRYSTYGYTDDLISDLVDYMKQRYRECIAFKQH